MEKNKERKNMANIKKELNTIANSVYGKEMRPAIHDGLEKVNKESTKAYEAAIKSQNSSKAAAEAAEKAREEAPFKNRDDFMKRTGVGQSVTQKLLDYGGILDDLPESAQINLFDLM